MPLYSYTAVHPNGKKVRGTVDAVSEDAAKSALKDLHYEVQLIEEASRTGRNEPEKKVSLSGKTFVFEGKDDAGVLKKGTLNAQSKKEAFESLSTNQGLALSRLSLLGETPQSFDRELEEWNKQSNTTAPKAAQEEVKKPEAPDSPSKYLPLFSTLRLYAGWLLAWYGLFIAFGYYAANRTLPWDIPFVAAFSGSTLVFTFVAAVFLFLLFSELHKKQQGSTLGGIFYSIVWVLLVLGVRGMQ